MFILFSLESDVACPVLSENLVVCFAWEGTHSEKEDMEDKS